MERMTSWEHGSVKIGAHIEHTYSKYCGKRCVRSVDGKEL